MRIVASILILLAVCSPLAADQARVAAAAKLGAVTVTVRMSCCESQAKEGEKSQSRVAASTDASGNARPIAAESKNPELKPSGSSPSTDRRGDRPDCVTVCTGVAIAPGVVVTSLSPPPSAKFRVTLPGGKRATAHPRVIDHYSGLLLLGVEKLDVPAVEMAERPPAVGATIFSSAAWGNERPTFSQGMISAVDRSLAGTNLPPLLQLDLRTVSTSGGAAVIDGEHRLHGIIVAHERTSERGGWAYAVPTTHLRRMVKAYQQDQTVTLERRRPVVGFKLDWSRRQDHVLVRHVERSGPAHKAGLREAAQILEVDAVQVRSPFEVMKAILARQPGDILVILVRQPDKEGNVDERKLAIKLAGETGPPIRVAPINEPQVNVKLRGQNVEVQSPTSGRPVQDQARLLEEATSRYLVLIEKQRTAITTLEDELRARDTKIDRLLAELVELKKLVTERSGRDLPASPASRSASSPAGGSP
jgi:S1-C subfamily serine protease